jgi:phage shock protein A
MICEKCEALSALIDGYRRERDEARAQLVELREECAHLKHREVMLKRAHGALTDAGCVVPLEFDRTIEHAINALAERALTAEERLERVTHERDHERTVFERAMGEAQTDVRELRARIAELEKR